MWLYVNVQNCRVQYHEIIFRYGYTKLILYDVSLPELFKMTYIRYRFYSGFNKLLFFLATSIGPVFLVIHFFSGLVKCLSPYIYCMLQAPSVGMVRCVNFYFDCSG